jgi:hypothetical protein
VTHELRTATLNNLLALPPLRRARSPKKGNVLIAALTEHSIRGRRKAPLFFPDLCGRLAQLGYQTHFVFNSADLLKKSRQKNSCIIHLYNEERKVPDDDDVAEANSNVGYVFNNLATGRIIGNKIQTNQFLSEKGIAMPSMSFDMKDAVFTNLVNNTSRGSNRITAEEADPDRYNTKFIDTGVEYQGKEYRTTVRLIVVGRKIIHSLVGARASNAKNATVHGVNTPINSGLITHLFETQIVARKPELDALADKLDQCLGPGFYHHDLLIEKDTGDIYVCEVGIKFDAYAYGQRLESIRETTPCLSPFFTTEFAYGSAEAVLNRWETNA